MARMFEGAVHEQCIVDIFLMLAFLIVFANNFACNYEQNIV